MRKRLAVVLALALLAPPMSSEPTGKPKRVGFVGLQRRPEPLVSHYYNALATELRDLGWVEGKDLVIEWRFAEGHYERLPEIMAELVKIPVDVIVTEGTPGTQAAQKATQTIPIVFPTAGDPVGNGLVRSLARPGGHTTGISLVVGGVNESAKQIEMLRLISPGLTSVGVLVNPDNPFSAVTFKSLQAAVGTTGVSVHSLEVRTPVDVEAAFEAMKRDRTGAVILVADGFITQQRRQIAELAVKGRLASMAGVSEYTQAGGLLSYGQSRRENYRRAAEYVDKILKGANAGELPVQQPMTLELVINKTTANALGLPIPPELLVLADRVIE